MAYLQKKDTIFGRVLASLTGGPLFVVAVGMIFSQSVWADKAVLLEKDREALQARVDLIQQAKTEIVAEYFYVGDDDESLGGITLLLNAAQNGVKVRVIVDDMFNKVPRSVFALLEKYGKDVYGNQTLEVKAYNQMGINTLAMTHRDHAKILVADGHLVISGGRNVGDGYFGLNATRNFNDLDVMAEGDVAQQARANFMEVWNSNLVDKIPLYEYSENRLSGIACVNPGDRSHCEFIRTNAIKTLAKDQARLALILKDIQTTQADDLVQNENKIDWFANRENSVEAEFISHDPEVLNNKEHSELAKALLGLLKEAKTDVNIISPYLIPTPALMRAFKDAKDRNVTVRIITNSLQSTDNLFAQAGYRNLRRQMVAMGLEIYEYKGPDTVHAKTAVVDHKIAIVGTFNLDPRSAHLNREVAIKMTDSDNNKLINELTATIENFRARSILVAKEGIEYNRDKEFIGVSKKNKITLKVLNFLLPVIKNQL